MPELTMVEAVRGALRDALRADERVVVMGEDVAGLGGVFRATDGLAEEFGPQRVIDTPMAELSIVGIAIGMALRGMRPVAEIQFGDFIWAAADQIFNEAAKIRYRTASEWTVPLVLRATWGAGIHGALYHSQSIETPLCHYPGLKVVAAATAADAAGLLHAALADPDPVIVLEHKLCYRRVRDEVPDEPTPTPLGRARVARSGRDATVFAYGWMVHEALRAAERLAADGIEAEVIDLRSLLPLDRDTIAASAARTGRAVVVHEAVRTLGLGAEVAATVQERCFDDLRAPVARVTMPDVAGTPFAETLEPALIPDADNIEAAVREVVRRPGGRAAAGAGASGRVGVPQASMSMTAAVDGLDENALAAQLVAAAAGALLEVPEANGVWTDAGLRHADRVHVALVEPGADGTARTLVVADADERSAVGIARELDRQRSGSGDDGPAPTFTLVVPGGRAALGFPLVPEGQTAVVQAGAVVAAPVVEDDALRVRRQVTLALSADHRVLDGAGSARFLSAIVRRLEAAACTGT